MVEARGNEQAGTVELAGQSYRVGEHPDLPPPPGTVGVVGWLRQNLFSSIWNSLGTIIAFLVLVWLLPPIIQWAFIDAVWSADNAQECRQLGDGACWAVIDARFRTFIFGFYPAESQWRPTLVFVLLFVALYPLLFQNVPYRRQFLTFTFVYPFLAYFLLGGGIGLDHVETEQWGGLMLNLVIGVTGIAASLPIGILLALGRRSDMPVVRSLCIAFIELVRGVPLITVLFMASVMLPLFLPEGVNFDKLLRAVIGVTLFSAAYMAEVVRGGLQAIPTGQYEAAQAMGLSYWRMMGLIILPQALRIVIPGIVNTFIGLFKDTTLVLIIGLLDLLGMARSALSDAEWLGLHKEAYIFVAICFFIFCFVMSRYSIYLEKRLQTDR